MCSLFLFFFFFSSRRRHTRYIGDWSSDVCSSDLTDRVLAACEGCGRQLVPPVDRRVVRRSGGERIAATAAAPADQLVPRPGHERSEERRVGKESRCRWAPEHEKKRK